MNIINVSIDFQKGLCEKKGISIVTGDYNSTKIVFSFDESANNKTKIFEMKSPNNELIYVDEIINNEVVLAGIDENEQFYSLFAEEGDYTFEVSLYGLNSKITSVYNYITANKEQIIVEGEVVSQKANILDNLLSELQEEIEEVNQAILETNNLDIDANKVDKTATIDITKKDGTQKSVQIRDGYDLEYNWQGTELGIKREDEPSYNYVDLKGEKGECNFATFEIVNARLKMNKPDNLNQIDFRLNNLGHLEVEVTI